MGSNFCATMVFRVMGPSAGATMDTAAATSVSETDKFDEFDDAITAIPQLSRTERRNHLRSQAKMRRSAPAASSTGYREQGIQTDSAMADTQRYIEFLEDTCADLEAENDRLKRALKEKDSASENTFGWMCKPMDRKDAFRYQ